MPAIGSLSVFLTGNFSGLSKSIDSGIGMIAGFGAQLGGSLTSMAAGMGALVGVGSTIEGLFAGFGGAVAAEQAQVAFETMLGSADQAKKVIADLTDFAASTPFELPQLRDAAKQLVAFGVEGPKTVDTLRKLGDVASLTGIPIGDMAGMFGKAKTMGQLNADVIMDMTKRGVPAIRELAKVLGVSEGSVKDLASKGQVHFSHLEQAFTNMTSAGGMFAGGMDKQSKTLGGLWSTLKDNIGLTLTSIAEGIISTFSLKDALAGVIGFTDRFKGYIAAGLAAISGPVQALGGQVAAWFGQVWAAGVAAWDGIQAGAAAAFTFLRPTFDAFVGAAVAGWEALSAGAANAWGWIVSVADAALTWIGNLGASVWGQLTALLPGLANTAGATWAQIRDGFTDAFGYMNFFFGNFASFAELAWVKVKLGAVVLGNDLAFLFTDKLPAAGRWFAENWRDIFTDLWNFTKTVFTNLGANIVAILKNLPGLISGSVSLGDLWKPLTAGFERATKELKLPERVQTDLETQLANTRDTLADGLAAGWQQARREGVEEMKGLGKELTEEANKAAKAPAKPANWKGLWGLDKPGLPKVPGAPAGLGSNVAQKEAQLGALEFGSKEASAVLAKFRERQLFGADEREPKVTPGDKAIVSAVGQVRDAIKDQPKLRPAGGF